MKNLKNILLPALFACVLGLMSCADEKLDPNSIFPTDSPKRTAFDLWILNNYTRPYNIDLKYKMEDIESDTDYTLTPADLDKSVALAKFVLYLWIHPYDEIMGVNFMKQYVPRVLHFIGSPAYNNNGTIVLGTAEGGLKVTLYMVNLIDLEDLSIDFLNYYYFKTMHHEFAHILTQTKNYDSEAFQKISMADYESSNWYLYDEEDAYELGFVSPYAMSESNEDFAENIAVYITSTEAAWNAILTAAGTNGRSRILQKFEIVKKYLLDEWNMDLDKIRDEVQWRSLDLDKLDLTMPN